MAYTITSQCIACDRCVSVCPTGAIQKYDRQYQINTSRCNDCVGHYGTPQCWAVCPTNEGCIPEGTTQLLALGSNKGDYWERWFEIYHRLLSRLHQSSQSEYWEQWFNTYAQKLSVLLHQQA